MLLATSFNHAIQAGHAFPVVFVALFGVLVAAVFVGIAMLNGKAARKLQRQIDELDEAGR